MKLKKSPLAPRGFAPMPKVSGLEMWTAESGLKYKSRPDILLVKLCAGTSVAGVFTRSQMPGAPVVVSKNAMSAHSEHDQYEATCGMIVNAGNANVFTGDQGLNDAQSMAAIAGREIGAPPQNIYVSSTGVIGEPLDMNVIAPAISGLSATKRAGFEEAARAISTTDTFQKGAAAQVELDGVSVSICGIAKGSGMVMPDMATMLGYIFTDANIARPVLQSILTELCETSFNAITVDSDTSTSDTVLLAATGKAGHDRIAANDHKHYAAIKHALAAVMVDLAQQIVRDGEGAKKFIEINVCGAVHANAAKTIAMSVANAPLVKTAIAGEDANWGRVIMAIGKAGIDVDPKQVSIAFGPHLVADHGARAGSYDEEVLSAYMKNQEILINIDLGDRGNSGSGGQFTAWTCDLTHDYIDINADYRS